MSDIIIIIIIIIIDHHNINYEALKMVIGQEEFGSGIENKIDGKTIIDETLRMTVH